MSSAKLKVLRSLNIDDPNAMDDTRGRRQHLNPMWSQLIELDSPDVLHLCESIYYSVLEHYQTTRHACPMAYLSRSYNKRLGTILKRYALSPIKLNDLIDAAIESDTLPLVLMRTRSGSTAVTPSIVVSTIINRCMRGVGPDNSQGVMEGTEAGPILSEAGIQQAYAPFVELIQSEPEQPPSDNFRQIDYEIDSVDKSVDSVDNSPSDPNVSH